MGFDTNGVCGIHEDAGVLRSDDRLDDGGQVVHVRQGLDAQNDIVVRIFSGGCFFWGTDDCRVGRQVSICTDVCVLFLGGAMRGRTMTRFEAFIPECFRSIIEACVRKPIERQ